MTIAEINKELKLHYARIKELKEQKKKLIYSNPKPDEIHHLDPYHTNNDEYHKCEKLATIINCIAKTDDKDAIIDLIRNVSVYFIKTDGKTFSDEEAQKYLDNVQTYLNHFKGICLDEEAKLRFMVLIYPLISRFGLKAADNYEYYSMKSKKEKVNIKLTDFLRPDGSMKRWEDKYE